MSLRGDVLSVLDSFDHADLQQLRLAREYRDFVDANVDAVRRSCAVGHVTASALVVDERSRSVLLTLHPKVGRWLQLGGHLEDDDVSLRDAALREVAEECGITAGLVSHEPVRLDRHPVPCGREADGSIRRSVHWDVQYAVRVIGTPAPVLSDESDDLRWFEELPEVDASVTALTLDVYRALDRDGRWVSFG